MSNTQNKDLEFIRNQVELMSNQLETLRKEYFKAITRLTTQSYSSRSEQMEDIEKSSKLGLAVTAANEAMIAINKVRWG